MKKIICIKGRHAGGVWVSAVLSLAFFAGGADKAEASNLFQGARSSSGYSGNNSGGADFQRINSLLREAENGPARNIQSDIRELKRLLPRLQSEVSMLRQQAEAKKRELEQAEQQFAQRQAQEGGGSLTQKAKGFFKKLGSGDPPSGYSSWQEYYESRAQNGR